MQEDAARALLFCVVDAEAAKRSGSGMSTDQCTGTASSGTATGVRRSIRKDVRRGIRATLRQIYIMLQEQSDLSDEDETEEETPADNE
jgi:hypothetical protein